MQDAEWNEQGEVAWGDVLTVVMTGLTSGRNFLWEEACGKLSVLFGSPLAFNGDQFVTVSALSFAAISDVHLVYQ